MVEVKTSSSKDTQVPFQIGLLNGPLDPIFILFVRNSFLISTAILSITF
jgi:hypothetical protein